MTGTPGVIPYLTVADADAAIAFYEKVFGAELSFKMMDDDGVRYMHATISINGGHFMLSSEYAEQGGYVGPDRERGSPVALSLQLDTPSDVDRVYALAMENGATESWKPEDMFWGDRFAQLVDVAGHRWMLISPLPDQQQG